jgi:hypothetical protein
MTRADSGLYSRTVMKNLKAANALPSAGRINGTATIPEPLEDAVSRSTASFESIEELVQLLLNIENDRASDEETQSKSG